jgi:putative flavoprotein involved in K+ transport
MEQVDVAVVGGGQAGLALSHELTVREVEHVVLERGRVAQTWRDRWDSFCLVTPNWSVRLPGHPYDGPDPDGYLPRDRLVEFLLAYADAVRAPVREGVEVTRIRRDDLGFDLDTSEGALRAAQVVLATGAYQRPYLPSGADGISHRVAVLTIDGYTNEGALPPGRVLIVGSGQSGCQIAEELTEAGREVALACGRAPWMERRIGGRDIVHWLIETGFMTQPVAALSDPSARLDGNILSTGHGGGHDLHLRTLQSMGVRTLGRFLGAEGGTARFAQDLDETIAWGDDRRRMLAEMIRKTARARGLEVPGFPEPGPFDTDSPDRVDLAGFGAVIFTAGFRPDYRSWLPWPDAFDEVGFPLQLDGASTVVAGLWFLGVHFLRTRASSLLLGVGEDAAEVADGLRATRDRGPWPS